MVEVNSFLGEEEKKNPCCSEYLLER